MNILKYFSKCYNHDMPRLSREIQFANKVLTQTDLVRLVDLFSTSIVKRPKTNFYSELQRVSVSTTTKEGVDYSFDETELKSLNSHFQQKQVIKLTASYNDNKTGNEINFRLTTDGYGTCYFQLNSKDEKWLDHKYAKANEYLNSLKEQNNFYISNRNWLIPIGKFILALPLTYIFVVMLVMAARLIPKSQNEVDSSEVALATFYLYLFLTFINIVLGELIVSRFFRYLDSMWPPIEISTGPEHLNKLLSRRKFWNILCQIVIIPVAISLIFFAISGIKIF